MREQLYRKDIDGLRAIAVMAVVAFHLGIPFFSGGYIGVDIFFVISGYLIGSHLLKELAAGHFSAAQFYKRRVLRIAPALFVLLLALCLLLPFLWFPSQIVALASAVRSVLLSASNFYFASNSNYFSDPLGKPLLHTWSLAVEEQFYVVLPLLLLAARRKSEKVKLYILISLFCVSFVFSLWQVKANPNNAFYLPFSRSWELLLGTLLSFAVPWANRMKRWYQEALLGLGFICVLVPIHYYSSRTPFPGLAALPPCFGAALLILFGGSLSNRVNSPLRWKPVVFVGLISYSLYLWHWPVTVLTRMDILTIMPYSHRAQTIFIVLASISLAIFSWRFVERPFRSQKVRLLPPKQVLITFAAACVALVGMAAGIKTIPSPYPKEAIVMSQYINQVDNVGYRKGLCYIGDPFAFADFHSDECLSRDPVRPNVLILGDSHAAAIYPGLQKVFPEVHFLQATAQDCKPIRTISYGADCDRLLALIYDQYLPQHKLDGILLIGRWLNTSDAAGIESSISYLRSIDQKPILIGPALEYRISLPMLLAYSISRHNDSLPKRYQADDLFTLDQELKNRIQLAGVTYISQIALLCPRGLCATRIPGSKDIPVLFDTNHFTLEGSMLFASRLRSQGDLAFLAPR